jgi:hypothetical protein
VVADGLPDDYAGILPSCSGGSRLLACFSKHLFPAIVAALCVLPPAPAGATGAISIHHASGASNSYSDVEIRVFSGSLFLTSDDGDGTIVVTRAACSYQGKIIVCLPISAALVQDGESSALALRRGTIYLNYTSTAQSMSFSSSKLPAKSILLALTLNDGTLINVHGRIDQVIEQ